MTTAISEKKKKPRAKPMKAGAIIEPINGSEEDRAKLRCKITDAPKPPKKWGVRYLEENNLGKLKWFSKAHLKKHYKVI